MRLAALLIAGVLAAVSMAPRAQTGGADVVALLLHQDDAALEAAFGGAQQRFERGALTEDELRRTFEPFASLRDAQALEKLRDWAARAPQSYAAHLALGLNYRAQGSDARGTKSWARTAPEQRDGLVRHFTLAEPELRASLALTARPYLSLLNLMAIAGTMQNRPFLNASLLLANEALPGNELARLSYAHYLLPRWGGSYDRLDAFVAMSRAQGVAEGTLLKLQAVVLNDRGQTQLAAHDAAGAEARFRDALQLARQAGDDGSFRATSLAAAVKRVCKDAADEPVCQPAAPGTAVARPAAPSLGGPLGGDVEHAVVIPTSDGAEGVRTEYAWLAMRYPAAKRTAQALIVDAGKHYDVLSVTTAQGRDLTLYFDITAFSSGFLPATPAKAQAAGPGKT